MSRHNLHYLRGFALSLIISILMTSCTSTINNHGYIEKPEEEAKITPGTSKIEVIQLLGTPSTVSNFGPERWYYISKKTESIAFFDPKLLDQKVFYIEFNGDSVAGTGKLNKAAAKELNYASEKTATEGTKLNVMEQLIGNLGRFNSSRTGRINPNPSGNY